jgi:hypothetical protein
MDPAVVGSNQFGQLFKSRLPGNYIGADEAIFSQPLVYTPNNDTKQYVYWATTQNNLYKMDAKTGEIVASRSLHIPFLTADLDGCVDINPTIGVISTGVIDPETETLYLTAKTYLDQNAGDKPQGRDAGRYYLHAIDVNDLKERPNFPVNLEGTIARNNPTRMFTGGIHLQRPALLHAENFIYAGFASHCVQYNFTGWIMGWDATTGEVVERYAMEGDGVPNDVKGGGVWMSGGGLSYDGAGSIFYATGNGYASQLADIPVKGYNPPSSLEEAAVHMTLNGDGSLNVVDFFMPWEKQALDGADKDLGTSPLEILPSQFACGDIKRIGVVTGKSGKTYWLNLDNLGGYRNGPENRDAVIKVYQNDNSVYAGAGVYPLEGGYVYINVIQHESNVFKFSCDNGAPSFTLVAKTPEKNAYVLGVSHGTTTSLNGQPGTGLLWITDVQGLNLRVYDAVPQDGSLNLINSFNIPGVVKFGRPVFGDGIVYVGTNQGFVYGYGSPVNQPLNCTSPVDFGEVDIKATSDTKVVTCKANIDVTVTGIELSEGTDFSLENGPTGNFDVAAGKTFDINAKFTPSKVGLLTSDVIVNTTNSEGGYSLNSHARLTGTGASLGPLLEVSPNTVTFDGVVTGNDPNGVTQDFFINNLGNSPLTLKEVTYSSNNSSAPPQTWSGQGDLVVGKFTLKNIPNTIEGKKGSTISIVFDSSTSGTYSAFIKFTSDGGTKSLSIAASAGPAAKAVLEFQTIDGTGWVPYEEGKPFTLGNVTENQSRPLKFRVTNGAGTGGVKLSLTVSKPPFGVEGIIKAANQVDLAEGTSLAPGESASAVLTCAVPKSQWNMDPYNGTAQWTMNTNDPNFGKQFIQFYCNAVTEQAPPLLDNGLGVYRYKGCFKENNPGRQLEDQLYGDKANTNAMCIAACAKAGFTFCGTQYHTECWAGNYIPVEQVDEGNCNFDCGGDLNQICGGEGIRGGGSYISLFMNSNANETQPPTGPSVNPGVDGYQSIGCYTEAPQGRALPDGKATDKKTVALCIDACKQSNYMYAGLEYGGECWCGNQFTEGSVPAPMEECKMTCNDNSTEYCGGPGHLNVYKQGSQSTSTPVTLPPTDTPTTTPATESPTDLTTTTPVTSPPTDSTTTTPIESTTTTSPIESTTTTTTPTPTPTGPMKKPVVSEVWNFQGCWTEATNGRALSEKTYADDTMTLESCAEYCAGFTYFGVEYGRECYCGNGLREGSVKAENQNDCDFICPGDKSEYCGAGLRLELYKYSPENSNSQAPTSTSSASPTSTSTSTPESTADSTPTSTPAESTSPEPTTSATPTEATEEPSTSETPTSTPEPTTTEQTSTPEATTSTPASTTSEQTSTPGTSSTSSAAPTPTGPSVYPGNANYTYYACISEPSGGRLLGDQVYNDGKEMTIETCLQRCSEFKWVGVEYGRECWCGDELRLDGGNPNDPSITPGKNVTDSQCDFLCPGDRTHFCGAGLRLSAYLRDVDNTSS